MSVPRPSILRDCRETLQISQAAFARQLGVPVESYRTWDSGRRTPPGAVVQRARGLAGHRDDAELLPLQALAGLVGVHVRTLHSAAREGLHPGITDEDHTIEPRTTDIMPGELFELGRHRLLCGDATKADDVTRLLAGATPVLMITDPPYGVTYDPAWRSRACPGQRTAVGAVRNDDSSADSGMRIVPDGNAHSPPGSAAMCHR